MTLASVAVNSLPLVGEMWTTEVKLPTGDRERRRAWLMAQEPTNACRINKVWRSPGSGHVIYVEYQLFHSGGGLGDPEKHIPLGDFLETWVLV